MRGALERYFEFERLGTTWRTEILAGLTTFMTMAYIIFVNPSVLREAGMPFGGVLAATCLSAGIGSILMGAFARYPIALAPGMGLNAFFAFAVVKGMGVPWQTALGAVFLSGCLMLLLTLAGIRKLIVESIPRELFAAVAVGIGLFIAFIGLKNAGIVVANPATLVTLGNLRQPTTVLSLSALLLMAVLFARGVRAAILIGILVSTAAGVAFGIVPWSPGQTEADLSATALHLDIASALKLGLLEIIFVFLFVDLFDNVGTLVAVGKKAGLIDQEGRIPRINRILTTDATASIIGSLAGTSSVVSYIESASGVTAGGRSGVVAIVAGVMFLIATSLAGFVGVVPAAATAPALILVGSLMVSHASEIPWNRPTSAIPAFLILIAIPLTFSIANGLALGFTAYALMKLASGEGRQVNWFVYLLAALFILRFMYLGQG